MSRSTWYTTMLAGLIALCAGTTIAHAQAVRRSDYRINDEDSPVDATTEQLPDLASSPGGFTAVWQSSTGALKHRIMMQRFDTAGRPLGAAVPIDVHAYRVWLLAPHVARYSPNGNANDSAGTSVVVWSETWPWAYGYGGTAYGQVMNNNGSSGSARFLLDSSGTGKQYDAVVAMHPAGTGTFVAAWADHREGGSIIMARVFNRIGDPVDAAFRVHDDTARHARGEPAIAIGGAPGTVVIAWQEGDGDTAHVAARAFALSGAPLGPVFRVDSLVPNASEPGVAVAEDGSFVVVFKARIDSLAMVYAQRFGANGRRLGAPIPMAPIDTVPFRHTLDVAMHAGKDTAGYGFVVAWEQFDAISNHLAGVHVRSYNGAGIPNGAPIALGSAWESFAPSLPIRVLPAVATLGFGDGAVPRTRTLLLIPDTNWSVVNIYGQILESGVPTGERFRVNKIDTGGAAQQYPSIDVTPTGMQVVVWLDERLQRRGEGPRLFGRRLASDGTPLGPDFQISPSSGPVLAFDADVTVFADSSFVVAWITSNAHEIRLQRFDARGEPVGPVTLFDDRPGLDLAVDGRPDGRFVMVVTADGERMIRAVRYRADGTPDGGTFRVDDDTAKVGAIAPAVAMGADGTFMVTWWDDRSGSHDAWAQRFDSNGARVGGNIRVNPVAGGARPVPAIDIAPNGTAMIAWVERSPGPSIGNLMAQRFDRDGAPIGDAVRVNDRDMSYSDEWISVAAAKPTGSNGNDGSFVVTWSDIRDGDSLPNIYAQWYRTDGSPAGGNVRISNGPARTSRSWPDVARDGRPDNGAYFAWMDDRAHAGEDWSIWGAILDTALETSGVERVAGRSSMLELRAYPTPATDRITFNFSLPQAAHARLALYTLEGTRVATVLDGRRDAGHTRVEYPTDGMASGTYLYRLESGTATATGIIVVVR